MWQNFRIALEIMGKGMGGIFISILIIVLLLLLLQRVLPKDR